MNPDEAVKVVADHLKENNGDSSMVAHKLVASARDAGSSDNITVIVVFLRDMSTAVSVSEELEWTENSFQDGQEDNGDDKEDHGDCKRAWPQHQVSAPADLGYDGRVDSFTDRTTLSTGASVNFVEDQGYLEMKKTDVCKLQSAKRLPPGEGFNAGIPKRATLGNGLSAETMADVTPLRFESPRPQEYCIGSEPPASLEEEWFKSWGRKASIFSHFRLCDAKRWQRLARLKPKLHMLLFGHIPLSQGEGLALCSPSGVNGRRNRWIRNRLWQGFSSCRHSHTDSILVMLRQSHCIPDPELLWSSKK